MENDFIFNFFKDVIEQKKERLREYFDSEAKILWYETNEKFTVDEYLIANCEYPGDWIGEVKRVESIGDLVIFVGEVMPKDKSSRHYCTSFMKLKNNKIVLLEEYWTEEVKVPIWRKEKNIGCKI
ncbi:MAG: nuclear transport factor 2 family protein [Cetobacterium sp.]|uniref:nuclear transport factor 2 family protein n=1 Tax=Cetobacterium sp. TaxID=2071632 RepID=UPI003F373A61